MKDVYGSTVNRYMCSPMCPCDQTHYDVWKVLTINKAEQGRVQKWGDLDSAEQALLGGQDNELTWLGNINKPDVVLPLVFKPVIAGTLNKKGGQYDNFKACYDTTLKTAWAAQ